MIRRRSNYSVILQISTIAILLLILVCLYIFRYFHHPSSISSSHNGVTISVDNVAYDSTGHIPFAAPAGYKFVIVHAVVKNSSSQAFYFAPVVQTIVRDQNGTSYSMSPTALADPIVAGKLNPGEAVKGSLSYLVHNSAAKVTLLFKP